MFNCNRRPEQLFFKIIFRYLWKNFNVKLVSENCKWPWRTRNLLVIGLRGKKFYNSFSIFIIFWQSNPLSNCLKRVWLWKLLDNFCWFKKPFIPSPCDNEKNWDHFPVFWGPPRSRLINKKKSVQYLCDQKS